ncbi:MAG TPA: hypothetical protein VHM25_10505 [Polyangiaceae bacterium]|nr:hypothetical protein [Polyangiaceae bacterium]
MLYCPRLVDAMHGRTVRGFSTCVVLSVALLSASLLCAQESGPTLLAYHATESCPGVADFQRSVQRRSTRVHFVERGPHDRELSIVMRQEGEATHGELRLVERDGRVSQRNVRFTTCAEAVEGLALIAVVSLDPHALLEPSDAKPDAVPPAAASAPPAPSAPPATVKPKRDSSERDSLSSPQKAKSRVALGAAFNVAPSALPETALGGSVFIDVAWPAHSHFTPLFRFALSHVQRRGLSSADGAEANFTLSLATASVCPLRLPSGPLEFRACGFASGGLLHAWGAQTTNLQQRNRPYGAVGGSLLASVSASQTIDIVADLAVGATLLRDSFGFEQDQPWQTPSLYLSSGIGARFAFP